jgi:hypothetical protein
MPISESEMSPTSPTILDDLDIPERTPRLAIMGKGRSYLFPLGVEYRAQEVQIRWSDSAPHG